MIDIDFKKMVQVIDFFAINLPQKTIGKIDLLKAVFFADRYHMLKNCRTVTGDEYYAMKHGPVASTIKNICNCEVTRLSQEEIDYAKEYLAFYKNSVHSKSKYEDCFFSESDKEALNESLNLFRRLKNEKINVAEYSHRFFDWERKYAPFLPQDEDNRIDMDMDEFFDIRNEDDYCSKIDRELRELNRELINL